MEDDDEFGDLYTDVLRPLTTSIPSQPSPPSQSTAPPPRSLGIDLNIRSNGGGSLGGASDSALRSLAPVGGLDSGAGVSDGGGSTKFRETGFGDPNLLNESGIDLIVEERDERDVVFAEMNEEVIGSGDVLEKLMVSRENFGAEEAGPGIGSMGMDTMIPGLSNAGDSAEQDVKIIGGHESTGRSKAQGTNFDNFEPAIPGISDGRDKDDSDSDSDDDLQIVLNDDINTERSVLMDRNKTVGDGTYDDDEDEDDDALLIVADDGDMNSKPLIEEQEWIVEATDGERKDLDDAAKPSGGASVAPKSGYSNHGYHPYHSQFKYVRPGAVPIPGTTTVGPGGVPSQVRPPVSAGPIGGRGRGDWRPAGVKNVPPLQKGFHPGYGVPAWGNNAPGHGFGGGLEFTLPSHKTVFEVDIDGFDEKPWRVPGVDISDYFNFGLDEESWKEYCKKLEQHRLEATMQSKIRVYESGRTEQDYDPDMPPELAAAAGMQDVPPSAALAKMDAGQTDVVKGPRLRPPLPTGRPIQVENGYGERLPSIDTRPPRIRDSDAIIEIVLQESLEDDSDRENNLNGRLENEPSGEGLRRGSEIEEDVQHEEREHSESFSHAYGDVRKHRERKELCVKPVHGTTIEGDEILPRPSESPLRCCPDSREQTPECTRRNVPQEQRQAKGKMAHERSPNMTSNENMLDKSTDHLKEESVGGINCKDSPRLSSPVATTDAGRQVVDEDATQDKIVLLDGNSGMENGDVVLNTSTNNSLRDENLRHSPKKQKLSSRVEQPSSQEIDDGDESKVARSSDNSRARSGSSKDFRKSLDGIEEEVLQDGNSTSSRNGRRPTSRDGGDGSERIYHEKQETEKHRMTLKGRDESYSRRDLDSNAVHHVHMKGDSIDRRKESDKCDGAWQHRNDDLLSRRSRGEEAKRREHSIEGGSRRHSKTRENERSDRIEIHQSRKQFDDSTWRAQHGKDLGSRHKDRDDSLKSRNESLDFSHGKRRRDDAQLRREYTEKEEIMHRESSSRRKRERDDILDQRKKDDQGRLRDDDLHYLRTKDDALYGRDKVEKHREREDWHRLKRSHEDIYPKRASEEARSVRSRRTVEERGSANHSNIKDDYKSSDKEYYLKDSGRHGDQLKRRDRAENESASQHRGHEDVYARGVQPTNDERRSRHDKSSARYDHSVISDNHQIHDNKHKGENIRGKESEDANNSLVSSRSKQEDQSRRRSEMGYKGKTEQARCDNENPLNHQSSKSHGADVSSDDEQQDSRKGRSKLERWTSHKERDFSVTTKCSSSLKYKEIKPLDNGGPPLASRSDVSSKIPGTDHQNTKVKDAGDLEAKNVNAKPIDDKHMDTVAKLKKRSERFKIPLPNEKETTATKKMEAEPLPSIQNEVQTDLEVKPERPARKRRWTNN